MIKTEGLCETRKRVICLSRESVVVNPKRDRVASTVGSNLWYSKISPQTRADFIVSNGQRGFAPTQDGQRDER